MNLSVSYIPEFISVFSQAAIFVLAGILAYSDIVWNGFGGGYGGIISAITIGSTFFSNFADITRSIPRIINGFSVFKSFSLNQKIYEKKFFNKNNSFKFEKIILEKINLNFGEKNILKNFNLILNKEERILIKGKSGIGKSSIINLILKIQNNYEGDIFFNGLNYKNINDELLRNYFFYLSNNTELINTSLKNNISFFEKKISENTLLQALKKVNLDNLNLDYQINNQKNNLSEGQKQRIKIARSFVTNKPILIFDESFSNIDKNNLNIILKNIFEHHKKSLIICISHNFDEKETSLFDFIIDLNQESVLKNEIIEQRK